MVAQVVSCQSSQEICIKKVKVLFLRVSPFREMAWLNIVSQRSNVQLAPPTGNICGIKDGRANSKIGCSIFFEKQLKILLKVQITLESFQREPYYFKILSNVVKYYLRLFACWVSNVQRHERLKLMIILLKWSRSTTSNQNRFYINWRFTQSNWLMKYKENSVYANILEE